MATLKATKDKARFISNTISQDVVDGDWVDHEVITKYKLPEITITSSTATNIESTAHGITGSFNTKTYSATDLSKEGIATVTDANNIDISAVAGITSPPTKAFFNKTIDTTLSAEATGKCKSSTVTQIGVL